MKQNVFLVLCLAIVFILGTTSLVSAGGCRQDCAFFKCWDCGCQGAVGCIDIPICDKWLYLDLTKGTCQPCGDNGQPICADIPACKPRHTPNLELKCQPCGGSWQLPCVFEAEPCDAGRNPLPPGVPVLCTPCGGDWQPTCFSGSPCASGHNPVGLPDAEVLCTPCGGQDQPLCWTGDPCRPGYEVEGWTFPLCTLEPAASTQPELTGYTGTVPTQPPGEPLWGWADIHEHQFANMAYGGITLWGDVYHDDGVSAALAECDWTGDPGIPAVLPTYWGIPEDPPDFMITWLVGMMDQIPTEYAGVDLTFLRTALEGLEADLLDPLRPLGPVAGFIADALQKFNSILPWDTGWLVPLLDQVVNWLQSLVALIIPELEPAVEPLVHLLGPAFVRGLYLDLAPWELAPPEAPPVLSVVPRYGIHGDFDPEALDPSQFWLGLTNNISVNDAPYIFHGTSGYPGFKDWPSYKNGGHQQMYHKWVERAYQGGLRLLVNFTVNNEALCEMSFQRQAFASSGGCEDMSTVDRQIDEIYALQQFIDDQCGSPGCGWYRVVTSAQETREVIEQGKLAVIIGIEVDNLFNCKVSNDECDASYVRAKVQEYYDRGVRYMFPVHFWDNKFTGSALYEDMFTYAQTLTGGTCPQTHECKELGYSWNIGGDIPFLDFIMEDLTDSLGMDWCGPSGHVADCNSAGLTMLGRTLFDEMMQRDMLIDIDHLSGGAFESVMTKAQDAHYPVISSHPVVVDNYDPDNAQRTIGSELTHTVEQVERIRDLAGIVAVNMPRGECKTTRQFVEGWTCRDANGDENDDGEYCTKGYRDMVSIMSEKLPEDEGGYPRIAMVADMGAFLDQPGPRFTGSEGNYAPLCDDEDQGTELDYPFLAFDGSGKFDNLVTGDRTFDFNTDGVANYGMFIDLLADVKNLYIPDDPSLDDTELSLDPLFHSAEAFIRTWERIEHCTPDLDDPTITCPPTLITTGGVGGTAVTYDIPAEAEDYCDWSDTWMTAVAYEPPSGSHFLTGVTTVTSTATDSSANTSACQFDVQVSCLGINDVHIGTMEGRENKIEVKGTFRPAKTVDATAVDAVFTIDDGNGHVFTFVIPAGSFEVRGNPEAQVFAFDSPSQTKPGVSATFDFGQYTFELKVKDVPGTSQLVGNSLTIGLETGQGLDLNYGLETVEVLVTPQHMHYETNPKLDCSP